MTNMDGLVTSVKGVPLYTGYADCVPLFFMILRKKWQRLPIPDGEEP